MMFAKGTLLNDRYKLQEKLGDNLLRQTWLAKDNQSAKFSYPQVAGVWWSDAMARSNFV